MSKKSKSKIIQPGFLPPPAPALCAAHALHQLFSPEVRSCMSRPSCRGSLTPLLTDTLACAQGLPTHGPAHLFSPSSSPTKPTPTAHCHTLKSSLVTPRLNWRVPHHKNSSHLRWRVPLPLKVTKELMWTPRAWGLLWFTQGYLAHLGWCQAQDRHPNMCGMHDSSVPGWFQQEEQKAI